MHNPPLQVPFDPNLFDPSLPLFNQSNFPEWNNMSPSEGPKVIRKTRTKQRSPRVNQRGNLVATNLRIILKTHASHYDSSHEGSKSWKELYSQINEHNLANYVDRNDKEWIDSCFSRKTSKNLSSNNEMMSNEAGIPVNLSPENLFTSTLVSSSPIVSPNDHLQYNSPSTSLSPTAHLFPSHAFNSTTTAPFHSSTNPHYSPPSPSISLQFTSSIIPQISSPSSSSLGTPQFFHPSPATTSQFSSTASLVPENDPQQEPIHQLPLSFSNNPSLSSSDIQSIDFLSDILFKPPLGGGGSERSSTAEFGYLNEIQSIRSDPPPPSSTTPFPASEGSHSFQTVYAENINTKDIRATRVQCNAFVCLSDRNTKTNIKKLSSEESLDIICRLQACVFKYLKEYNGGDDRDVRGFIAQEVQQICPDLVEVTSSGILTVRTLEIIPIVCDAIRAIEDKYDALLEKVLRMDLNPCGPILLAYFEKNELRINPKALAILRDIKTRISVLGVCGEAGDGNSSLCNQLLPSKDTERYFTIGHTTDRCTKDIWMSYPIKQNDPKQGETTHVIIDCPGFDASDKGVQILSFLCFVSTAIIISQKTSLNNSLFEKLKTMIEVQKVIQKCGVPKSDLPSLILLIRDAQLERDKKISAVTHLDNILNKYDADLCKAIAQFSPRTLMDLPHPRETGYATALDALRADAKRMCAAKRSDGSSLVHRIDAAANALRSDVARSHTPSLSSLVLCRSVSEQVLVELAAGELQQQDVISSFLKRTASVPENCRENEVKELQRKIKVSELLRLADDYKYQLKEMEKGR